MTDLAASDLTYTINVQSHVGSLGNVVDAKIVFGDGALTYPTGGVPITKAKLGCPVVLHSFLIAEGSSGVSTLWKYDDSAETLRAYVTSTGAELSGAVAAQEVHGVAIGY